MRLFGEFRGHSNQLPHAALALFYGVDRSTITRAVGEVRPLLAARGFAVPGEPGLRLRTLADVFAYAASQGVHLRIDGTEVQVRRPQPNRPGRRAFVSGKKKQNTIKPTAISDGRVLFLWLGAIRPGRMHDATALRTEGIEDLLLRLPRGHRRRRLRVPGPGPRLPCPDHRPAQQAEKGRHDQPDHPAGSSPQTAILPADLRRARHRRAQAMEAPAALPRTPRAFRRHRPGHRRAQLSDRTAER